VTRARAAFAIAIFAAGTAAAADPQPPDRAQERARTFLAMRISDALKLPQDKSLEVVRILRTADDRREKLRSDRREVEKGIRAMLKGGKPDEAELQKLTQRASEIDHDMALVPETSFRELQGILTVEQQAKLALVRPQIQDEIRAAVRKRLEAAEKRKK
jgi:hypothetical protein